MLSDIDNGVLRLALRIYFIVSMTLLGIIGSQCCKYSAKLDLIHGRRVNLHRMTGWVQLRDVAVCIWKLRTLPGGWWLGSMMVIGGILTLVADLAVARLVYPKLVKGYCGFTRGLVVDWTDEEAFSAPPANGYPALIASNAQYASVDNGCDYGIYKKVPYYSDNTLCAGPDDIMGSWLCNDVQRDFDFPPDNTDDAINDWLMDHDLQYYKTFSTELTNGYDETNHLVSWSSSNDDGVLGPFAVRVSVDLNGSITATKTMKSFQCNITATETEYTSALNIILSNMESNKTLSDWVDGLEKVLYRGDLTDASPDIATSLEQYLNTLTMVQGGSNSVFNYTLPSDVPIYGCVVEKTYLSPGVLALVGFAALILGVTVLYYLSLIVRLGRLALPSFFHRRDDGVKNVKPVPDSILSWMLQASRENALGGQNGYPEEAYLLGVPRKERELSGWSFEVVDPVNGVARMGRDNGFVAPHLEQIRYSAAEKGSPQM